MYILRASLTPLSPNFLGFYSFSDGFCRCWVPLLCRWARLGHWRPSSRESLLSVRRNRWNEGLFVAGITSDLTRFGFGIFSIPFWSVISDLFALLDLMILVLLYDSFITHANRYVHLLPFTKGEDRSASIRFWFCFFVLFCFRSDNCFTVLCSDYQRSWDWQIQGFWICDLRLGAVHERCDRSDEWTELGRP